MVFRLIDESAGYTQLYYNYLVNWVRRIDSHKLDTLLLKAAKLTYSGYFFGYESKKFNYAKKKNIFTTEAEFTRNIVDAIYTELNNFKPIYSNETLDFGRTDYQKGQRIKYPKETLEQGRGNCIDASVLIASILEMIGLNPVIVIIPGHAFVGWETWKDSNNYEYLETTFLGYGNFQDAHKKGMEEFSNTSEKIVVNIKKCRDEGIYSVQ
ncbi:MAG: hypothetical protein A2057_08215 [Ignavibacteria bacterium GWA2_35_9]|nr:MAG: hypothetical protein A2057_08215 [Ignavibacteria bacterium GWA2_35_9]OGU46655.1 MAG: hypothetical protein A2000_10935 [Ignavibacteria bacterium GWB2_36_8]OGU52735.1 MAG: hypothetical protein A2080_10160 [Ignavibacteria bacterium GWC2_36_12]